MKLELNKNVSRIRKVVAEREIMFGEKQNCQQAENANIKITGRTGELGHPVNKREYFR